MSVISSKDLEIEKSLRFRTRCSLSDPLVQKDLGSNETLMLHEASRLGRGTRYRQYIEIGADGEKRPYIRMGWRREIKRYLTSCDVTLLGCEPILFQYRTEG